jgi:hypothetical protein
MARRAHATGRRVINRTRKVAHVSTTGLEVFDETLHKTNTWLKEIGKALVLDRRGAYQVLRAVLHSLRDRLTVNQAAQLGDQLPTARPVRSEKYQYRKHRVARVQFQALNELWRTVVIRLPPVGVILAFSGMGSHHSLIVTK